MPFAKLPGQLSFIRRVRPGFGMFYSAFEDGHVEPLNVVRIGIRGTQNVNKFDDAKKGTPSSAKRDEPANIQITDRAMLDPEAKCLRVQFDVRWLDISRALHSMAPGADFDRDEFKRLRGAIADFLKKTKGSEGLQEVSRRYARRLLSGAWLWRNRDEAAAVSTRAVWGVTEDDEVKCGDALGVPIEHFNDYTPQEKRLGEIIAEQLRGENRQTIAVSADVDFGVAGAQEVWPSQNYLTGKPDGFARSLLSLPAPSQEMLRMWDGSSPLPLGQAALSDQKIMNQVRCIDTWYPRYKEIGLPIPVEPNGASLDYQEFFRYDKENSAFKMLLNIDKLDPDTPEGMFVLACIIRGCVCSEKAAKPKKGE